MKRMKRQYFIKFKEKFFVYKFVDSYLNRSMEVSNLMKFYWDIEILKFLLLDNFQYDAFKKIQCVRLRNSKFKSLNLYISEYVILSRFTPRCNCF